MRTYATLLELVIDTGATLVEEKFEPEAFGSVCACFSAWNGTQFRLVWDGKENVGFLQSLDATGTWQNEAPFVRERMDGGFSHRPEFTETLNRMAG